MTTDASSSVGSPVPSGGQSQDDADDGAAFTGGEITVGYPFDEREREQLEELARADGSAA